MNRHPWTGLTPTAITAAITAVVAIVVAAPALAQNTTGSIAGSVVGADGKPVAGATVTILHLDSKSTHTTTTDTAGRYAARGLRVGGPYTLTISKGGLTDQREGVVVGLAETLNFDATLGGVTSTVVVTGQAASAQFNRTSMGSGTDISNAQLNAQASIARNLQDYARSDPRVAQTDKERGEISALGQNPRYNSILIDGVTINDTFGIEGNNLPTAKQPISIDAIQSVQINLSNYDVTQKAYTGANINAVTKSGTNEWKGSVYHVLRNQNLAGDRYNRTTDSYFAPPAFKETTTGFTLGGPLIQDKLFLFAGYEELHSNRAAASFGPLGDVKTNVGILPSTLTGAQLTAKNTYGIDIGSSEVPAGTELVVKDSLLKLDWNLSDQHRASVRYSKTQQSDPTLTNLNATALSLTSNWWTQTKSIETLVGQFFSDWSPGFSTEVKLSKRDYASVPTNNAQLPLMTLSITGALPVGTPTTVSTAGRTLFFGTDNSRQFNQLFTTTYDAYFAGNWTPAGHDIKFGADFSRNKVFNAFLQNVWGNYSFSCQNSSATYAYSFGAINCGTATAPQVEAAVLENFQKGRPSSYQVQLPAAGKTLDDGVARWSLDSLGVFAQDTLAVTPNLTVTAGVRLDQQTTGDKPLANAAALAPVGPIVNGRTTGGFGLDNTTTLDNGVLFEPRVGFNYNLKLVDTLKSQLRGGAGLFQGAAATVWLSNPYSNTGVATRIVGCGTSGFAACPGTGGTFSADINSQPTNFAGATPAANVDFTQPGLRQPAVWKANLAFESQLPWYGLVGAAELLVTKTDSALYYKHLNLGAPTKTGTDGRELFYTAQGYNPACWNASGTSITSGTACTGFRSKAQSNSAFNNVLQATRTSGGEGQALTLSLARPAQAGWGWSAAYTRTHATEVSPLTSSVSNSNFNARSIFNPNEEVAANSATLIRDRLSASATWSKAFIGQYKTTAGLFYEGRKGHPYSWTFRNDLNGDGVAGNDLMYIPTAPGSGEVVFLGDTATAHPGEDKFWQTVQSNSELNAARGKLVKRNGSSSPFVNNFDLRLSQELPGLAAGHKGVFILDVLNVGNLLNKRWGRIDEVPFQSAGGAARSFVNYAGLDANGKYVYNVSDLPDLTTRQVKGESQWAVQLTLRYEF